MVAARRFDVVLVRLDPTVGREIQKTRPCVVISPDEMNRQLGTALIAPMTTGGGRRPWRLPVRFSDRNGYVALDQIRTIDQRRMLNNLGVLDAEASRLVLDALGAMFAP